MGKRKCSFLCFTKGPLLILFWIFLLRACNPLVTASVLGFGKDKPEIEYVHSAIMSIFYLFLPVAGMIADMKFTRYSFGVFSSVLGLIASVVSLVGILVLNRLCKAGGACTVLLTGLSYIDVPLNQVAIVCFLVTMISLGMDQLISESTLHLSSFVWWYYWAAQLDGLINALSSCSAQHFKYGAEVINTVHISCMAVIVVMLCATRKCFTTHRFRMNPVKLLVRVLDYARKTNYPKNRSALTYWQNDYPPRIDFGKLKYGGPFSEEQVENVKTFFRLLPFLFCTQMVFIPAEPLGRFHQKVNGTAHPLSIGECLIGSTYSINFCIALVLIPLKLAFLDRLMRRTRFFSTILRQIGVGILLSITGKAILPVYDYYAKVVRNNNTYCLFSDATNITVTDVSYYPSSYYYLLIPKIISGTGTLLILPTSLEFIVAQSPLEMRGFLLGLMFAIRGLYEKLGWLLIKPFEAFPLLWPSCEFYYFILNTVIMLLCLVVFVPLSVWYKLRKRDDTFNAHVIAEEYYERDFDRRDQFIGSTEDSLLLDSTAENTTLST